MNPTTCRKTGLARNALTNLFSTAHGLFIYAATVCRFIEEGIQDFSADNLLYLILPEESTTKTSLQRSGDIITYKSHTKKLDMMYTRVLEHSLKGRNEDKEQLAALSRQVVGAIVILFDPLSPIAIARLLNIDDKIIKKRLNHLCSVLEAPNRQEHPMRLLHLSFQDYLLNNKRCCS